MTTKTNKPAKSLGKFLFKILISYLSRFQRGNWLQYQRCWWAKRPLIWAWLQKILACVLSPSRAPERTGPRYNVPLVPPARRPWSLAELPRSLGGINALKLPLDQPLEEWTIAGQAQSLNLEGQTGKAITLRSFTQVIGQHKC